MFTTTTPISEIINYLYESEDSNREDRLIRLSKELVNSIIFKIQKDGLTETPLDFRRKLFEIRLEIIIQSQALQDTFRNLNDNIFNRIQLQFDELTKYKDLEYAFVNSLNIYASIANQIADSLVNDSSVIEKPSKFTYDDFIYALKNSPGKTSEFYLSFIDSSLDLDYTLLVTELLFDQKVNISKSKREKLRSVLKNTTEEYALNAYQLELWFPDDEEESQWMRNIKIRISLLESKFNSEKLTANSIKTFF